MPLIAVTNDPISDVVGLIMQMRSPAGNVPVFVSHEAIQDIAPPAGLILQKFHAHRASFEAIASDKFDRGEVESDGSIRITTADLTGA